MLAILAFESRVFGADGAHIEAAQKLRVQIGRDAIGETALFAHLFHEARREPAAAEDVVHDRRGHVVRVLAEETGTAEHHSALRDVALENLGFARSGKDRLTRFGKRLARGQCAEHFVEHRGRVFGRDVADNGDEKPSAHERAARGVLDIVLRDRGDRFRRAVLRPAIGMAGQRELVPLAIGGRLGVFRLAPQIGVELRAHALDRLGVEARFGERKAQHVEGFGFVLGKRLQRDVERVGVGAGTELDRLVFQAALEGLRVHVSRPFVEERRRHLQEARLVRRVEPRAALEGGDDGDERHGVLAHEPGFDAAGALDAFDVGGEGRGDECDERDERGENADHHDLGLNQPVTDASGRATALSAASTSSGVTASMRSGQDSTSSTDEPVVRAMP